MHVLVRIRVHTNSKQDRRLNTLLIMGAETIPNSQVFRAWTLKKPTELSICLSPTHLIAYICCSANYALHLRLRSPAADCISHSLPRGRAWPPNQYASTLFVLASTPPHPPACVPSPIHPPHCRLPARLAVWLTHTLEPPSSSLAFRTTSSPALTQPPLDPQPWRPPHAATRIHWPRPAYISTALTQPYHCISIINRFD